MASEFMTISEVSEYLKLTRQKLYHFAQRGKIPAYKFDREWRFKKDRLEEWIKEQEVSKKKKRR